MTGSDLKHYDHVGIDIGYSNLKIAYSNGDGSGPIAEVLPAGAGPAELLSKSLRAEGMEDVLHVLVKDESGFSQKWVAGVERRRFGGSHATPLDDTYMDKMEYRALLHAALVRIKAKTVGHLVTGLPVRQASDTALEERLVRQLTGRHEVAPGHFVEIQRVSVLAQPVGGFMTGYMEGDAVDAPIYDDGRVLVLDPGFFTVDWALISHRELVQGASNSSNHAMSNLLEGISSLIKQEYNGNVSIQTLDEAVRNQRPAILINQHEHPLQALIEKATPHVTRLAFNEMLAKMRFEQDDVNLVLLVGGGAQIYRNAVEGVFKDKARIVVAPHPVSANVRGYWWAASEAARHADSLEG